MAESGTNESGKPAPKKGGRKPILEPELVAAALVELHGNVTDVAKRFNVHRSSVQELIDKRPHLQTVIASCRESMVDAVEGRFYADCLKDAPAYQTSRIFFLKTQGRHRGYIERQEIIQKKEDIGDEVRKRLDEVDSGKPGQSGQTRSTDTPDVANPAPPAGD